MIIAPGGGYSHLSIDKEGTDVAARFNMMGVHAFVLKYRLPARPETDPSLPKWWAPLMDAQRAVSYVRAHAADYGANNASAIGFGGFSAGGHLSAHIATAWAEKIYDTLDDVDATSCRPDFFSS